MARRKTLDKQHRDAISKGLQNYHKGRGLKKACWRGYEAVGTKTKNGRTVPNCVPKR